MFRTPPAYASRSAINVVFFGSDQFSLAHLKAIQEYRPNPDLLHLDHVVTSSSQTPVASYCSTLGLDYTIWPRKSANAVEKLLNQFRQADHSYLGLVASFGRFLPESIISSFPLGCINVHPSLLPRWRGPCPLLHTLLAGDQVTGISIIRLPRNTHTFDSGPVLYQHPVALPSTLTWTSSRLLNYLVPHSIRAMFEVLCEPAYLLSGHAVTQDALSLRTGLTPSIASLPNPVMGQVNWEKQSATDIVRVWHALKETSVRLQSTMPVVSTGSPSVAHVQLCGGAPMAVPDLTKLSAREELCIDCGDTLLREACNLLSSLPPSIPFGGLVYLRTGLKPGHQLLPFAFVACKPNGSGSLSGKSWLAIPSFRVQWPGSKAFRQLTAIDFYNGYLKTVDISNCRESAQLPRGCYLFPEFQSPPKSQNPLLSEPWNVLTPPVQLSSVYS
ncbi:unnamed protein product [Dicrocoelium dendriticum]|nr:unnamed protein product [Dicrocoelium dendriticum]